MLSPIPYKNMPLLQATRLGPYEILEQIGAGGMGEVYKAIDTRLGREVAIKVVAEHFSQRFEIEARTIAALNHPNICALHDIGPNYLIMEYIEGETLAARIRQGPLPLEQALAISIDIAAALSAAHRKGIIHRDLKPGNIMLTRSRAKLLDFGLANYTLDSSVGERTVTVPITGESQVVGTLPYMSPEQLQGNRADARSDIFAFGSVLYEMLTGQRAFERPSQSDTIIAVARDEPTPLRELVKGVPDCLRHVVHRCLRKQPEERYASAGELEQALEACRALLTDRASGVNLRLLLRQSKRPAVSIPLLCLLVAGASLLTWWIHRGVKIRWAKDEALPQVAAMIDREQFGKAYDLAVQAERYIPGDPKLAALWPAISWTAQVTTTPPGASVYREDYDAPESAWQLVGHTPIEKLRSPLVHSRWKFEKPGFVPVDLAMFLYGPMPPDFSWTVKMDEVGKAPPGMVYIDIDAPTTAKSTPVGLYGLASGLDRLPPVPLEDYWIDKYEVTNRQFKQFLDQGGYRKQEYWKQAFIKDGKTLSWPEAMDFFRDTTGRPGPASWVAGEYPRGQDDFPVTGVSWFEAAAYAEFAGKQLPTVYHWDIAATPWNGANMIPLSNFSGQGSARVGQYRGMSRRGVYDMAGNVKEWCANEANSGKRYILGGAWDDPPYMFNDPDARSPFERASNFGFRCARYSSTGLKAGAVAPILIQTRDFSREKPASDELFHAYRGLYSYDKTPLHAVVESTQQTEDWTTQKITFDAAYGSERMSAFLFLPKKAFPPFQTVVYFPGADALETRSSSGDLQQESYDFVIRSGRAVLVPIYKGTYERGDGLDGEGLFHSNNSYRDHVIQWSKDLGRSLDYLETRPDMDHGKLAYLGASWGAALGALLPAIEDRIRVCILYSPGFYVQKVLPEVDQLNFAPRVKVPVLMLNGRLDYIFPAITSQEPMFRMLGTPKDQKRRVLADTGHDLPRPFVIKETLDWLDRYLGPVKDR